MPTPTTSYHGTGIGNGYVPASTAELQIEFSRNPNSFAWTQFSRVVPNVANTGLYPVFDTDDPHRVEDVNRYLWQEGNDRPIGENRKLRFEQYTCQRYNDGFLIGNRAISHASRYAGLDLIGANNRGAAQKMATIRGINAATALTGFSWPTANISATVDALLSGSGLSWTSSSTTEQTIKKSFNAVARAINKQTGGVVRPSALRCVVDPDIAHAMSETAEINDYMKAHERTLDALSQMDADFLNTWALPPVLYGIRMVVDDTVRESAEEGGTSSKDYLLGNNAIFVTMTDGMGGNGGEMVQEVPTETQTLSTLTCFVEADEDMRVEVFSDERNKRTDGHVSDSHAFKVTSGISGYEITDVTT